MRFGFDIPRVIQGGMGVGVSNWRLARAVGRTGNMGVVSATVIDTLMVRRLQDGDPEGDTRRALAHFPDQRITEDILARYFIAGGKARGAAYKLLPLYKQHASVARQQLAVVATFAEVWLAKEGHHGPIGVNLLTKVQLPNLASLYGAMLAGVEYVLMGAGIPREIPGVLDAFALHAPATMRFDVDGLASTDAEWLTFDPALHVSDEARIAPLSRPRFLAVISANSLATTLARKANGRVDGFIVEGPTAGGHNAPPRGAMQLNGAGEPTYGDRDVVDLAKLAQLGLPFWVAGGSGSPEALIDALAAGASGIQVGTLFAFCDESGIAPTLKLDALREIAAGTAHVFTDPRASATGYPFKVLQLEETAQQDDARERICDLGYLRTAFKGADARIGYRCAAEPVADYVKKGGKVEDTIGRRCLCNALVANTGHAQQRNGDAPELPLLTSGDDLAAVRRVLGGRSTYSAADVLDCLLQATVE